MIIIMNSSNHISQGLFVSAADHLIDDKDLAKLDKAVSLFEQLTGLHKLRAQRLAVTTPDSY